MNVYKKLQTVRNAFLSEPIKKSGKNKFAGYEYFELGDFIPTIHRLFDHSGLIGVVRFHKTDATLTIYNSDLPEEFVVFTTPMVFASNPKGQPIQDLGSTHTYLRRYLWLMALEIVEHDAVDASAPVETKAPPKVAPTPPKVDPTPPEGRGYDRSLVGLRSRPNEGSRRSRPNDRENDRARLALQHCQRIEQSLESQPKADR
jgi:hypothetical protein